MAGTLPSAIEAGIVRKLFTEAERIEWVHMNPNQRSKQYGLWVSNPAIGGVLAGFMPSVEVRVWIKDGPMKEFSRAVNGQGKYAYLIRKAAPTPDVLVKMALGPEWQIVTESQQVKPLRVLATNNSAYLVFAWGPARDFKHLVWAALSGSAQGDKREWVLCLTAPYVAPTPKDVRLRNESVAARCGLRIVHLTVPERGDL